MKLVARDRWADAGPRFNRTAAEAVYKAMSEMDDDTALVYGRLLVAGAVHYDLIAHRDELAKAAGDQIRDRAEKLRTHYTRSAVAKARRGEDTTTEIGILVQIGKAFDFTTADRRRFAAGRTRGEGGRFVQEHVRIDTSEGRSVDLDQERAAKRGIPKHNNLEGADLAHYQQAMGQIQDLLTPFRGQDLNALLHLQVVGRDGGVRTVQATVGPDTKAPDVTDELKAGDRIETAAVSVTPVPGQANTAAFDALAAAGAPRVGGYVADAYDGGALDPSRLKQFNTARQTVTPNENFSSAARTFGRVERGSKILQDSLGPAAPPKLQYALAVANHVGQYGPEAQKVIGPAADRAAYRYRGTERATPDTELINSFRQLHAMGLRGENAREAARHGIEGKKPTDGWNPGPVLRYFRRKLPNADLNELHRRSGVVPPSEGIIIAADGGVAHQAVGYADDWYLPFNLRHLSALRGGEYMRTRSFGGPTTEDIYTGLVSGAKSMTVISHNGVYTVDFDQNLRGGRRFNDKAGRMVARYGQLLDAVRSEQVSLGGISPARNAELVAEAKRFDPDENSAAFKTQLRHLQTEERANPTLSRQESGEAALEWLRVTAADQGRHMTPNELVAGLIDERSKRAYLAHKEMMASAGREPAMSLADFRVQEAKKLEDVGTTPTDNARAIAEALGEQQSFKQAMDTAAAANAARVRALKLDGNGYDAALKALQEQFPYYIKADFKPWKDVQGAGAEPARTGAPDTGYVAPRFNRPMAAEAGYFEPRVGQGKVEASSTRFQNFRHAKGALRPVNRSGGTAEQPAAVAARPVATPVVSDADLQRAADLAMLDEVLAHKTFPPGARITGDDVGGVNIRTEINHPRFPASHSVLKQVFGPDPLELQTMPPNELHDLMVKLDALNQGEKVLEVKPATRAALRNGGKTAPPAAPPAAVGDMLRGVGQDFVFPGIAYDPLRPVGVRTVEDEYNREPTIKALVEANRLPPVSADKETFDAAVRNLRGTLQVAHARHLRLQNLSATVDAREVQAVKRDTEGLLRATQLRRRWDSADRPTPPPAPPEPAVVNQTSVEFHLPKDADPEDMERWREVLLKPLPEDDPRRTIGR